MEVPERGELGARSLVRLLQVPVLALDRYRMSNDSQQMWEETTTTTLLTLAKIKHSKIQEAIEHPVKSIYKMSLRITDLLLPLFACR